MIELIDVWKSYRSHRTGLQNQILRGVHGRIRKGDHVGILGRNGSGKSTLMRLLSGVDSPTRGVIRREMSISWPIGGSYGLQTVATGATNARFIARLYGTPVQQTQDFVEEFAELGRYFYEPVNTYSSGMVSRLLMGLSFAVDFDCYLVDEALSTGDARFAAKCRHMLEVRRENAAMILVSHNAQHVRQYCDTAAILRNGMLEFYEDVDEAIAAYQGL
ncbi:ABC transporter ATP-binding protein [Pseudoroseomonas ludipueritiae]|uniref:ABC transporter ATP-binding protein n=1 Tax=Pseudoroseomonas ludipueritiae TaxID=198093 RepID=A0ABR7RDJ7_9PROT|nr:ATP-binding cassette domain-containing protein [Pseudoroseomonas ludipueritiae]MBC9179917.1 ABC transporter ATP-binding protein [Pseudoroseomonas ludipueritiae]MCG7363252.1 ATP-binding cassette domain-containing protein [Roseomonas sp. ACRSG]